MFIIEKILLSFILGGTWLTFLIGSWHISLTNLLVFMAIDIVTGVIHSTIERKVAFKIAYRRFLKKGTIMLVIIVANLLDLLTVGGVPVFRTMAIFYYIGMEGISITENLTKIGVPLHRAMTKYIEQ